jgi:hypothetical protein
MTPIASSPLVLNVPAEGDGMITAGGTKKTGTDWYAAPTAAPHPPQNFVVVLTGTPQEGQVFPTGCGGAEEAGIVDCTGVPQIPQNFSVPVIGLPHDAQTRRDAGGVRGCAGGA